MRFSLSPASLGRAHSLAFLISHFCRLLDVARRRFAARGWKNVQVLCQDATFFTLPEWGDSDNFMSARGAVRSVLFFPSHALDLTILEPLCVLRSLNLQLVHDELFLVDDPIALCTPRPDRRAVSFITAFQPLTCHDWICRLDPAGLLAVADFYTSSRASTPLERAIGNGNERRTGFVSRWFWQIWYDFLNLISAGS